MPKENRNLLLTLEIEKRLSQPRQMVRYCLFKVQVCTRPSLPAVACSSTTSSPIKMGIVSTSLQYAACINPGSFKIESQCLIY